MHQNGVPIENGFIEFDIGEAFFEIVLCTTLKRFRVCGEVWFEDYHYRLVEQINQLMRANAQKLQENDQLANDKQRIISEAYNLMQERDKLQNERDNLILKLQNVYNSKSWRLTKPIRIIGRVFRKILGRLT
jgi:hypothetical protein